MTPEAMAAAVDLHERMSADRATVLALLAQQEACGDERGAYLLRERLCGIDAFNAELHKRMGSPPQWPWWQDLKN